MSDDRADGISHFQTGGADARDWFTRQWRIWPTRADDRYTTNLAFHHGGIDAYRALHGCDPEISNQLRGAIGFLDRYYRQSLTKGENA